MSTRSRPPLESPAPGREGEDSPGRVFALEPLEEYRARQGDPWLRFLDTETLFAGLYALAAGQSDPQEPHPHDELYSVVRGQATLVIADERHSVGPGTVAFVRAGVEHRFEDVVEDLLVLVFFSKAMRSEG